MLVMLIYIFFSSYLYFCCIFCTLFVFFSFCVEFFLVGIDSNTFRFLIQNNKNRISKNFHFILFILPHQFFPKNIIRILRINFNFFVFFLLYFPTDSFQISFSQVLPVGQPDMMKRLFEFSAY